MAPKSVSRRAIALDLISKALCIAALGYLALKTLGYHRMYPGDVRLILLLCAEFFTILLVVLSRPVEDVMRKPLIVAATVISSCYFIFLDLERGRPLVHHRVGEALQVLGILVELASKAWIWRRFGLLPANRGIVTGGPYRFLRHPMYFGYFLTHVGFLLGGFSIRNIVLYAVLYVFVVYRILKEEELLLADPVYCSYVRRVRFRLIPGLF